MRKEYKNLYEKFGLNVVYYRKRKKLTQLQLAGAGRHRSKPHKRDRVRKCRRFF